MKYVLMTFATVTSILFMVYGYSFIKTDDVADGIYTLIFLILSNNYFEDAKALDKSTKEAE